MADDRLAKAVERLAGAQKVGPDDPCPRCHGRGSWGPGAECDACGGKGRRQ